MYKKISIYAFIIFEIILNIIFDFNVNNYVKILNECFNKNITLDYKIHIAICFIFAFISILTILDILLVAYKNKCQNKGIKFQADDGTFGTADWMNEKEINNILGNNDTEGIILGKYKNEIIKLPFDSHFNKNICVFGSSR